ncbi:hemolysin [Candidatus Pacearchaeota archaeon]|nr:hemolysin [Candidatus Pacearchaeota archaeon]|tara:strand:- start:210 stop:1442 length:1233 start_codon:yes stop_codon:yes gene_type:complete
MPTAQIITLVILIFLSALFSGIETALMSLSNIKVNALLKQGKKGAQTLHRIKQKPHKLIITILIGNNLVNIGAASLATVIFTEMFGSSGVGIATGVMTFLILVFGEITPKTFATQNAERVSLAVARPIELLSIILSPIVKIFEVISHVMSKLLGSKEEEELSEEELRTIVTMGAKEGVLNKEAAEMMHNVMEFKGTKVTQVMTPDVKVEMVDGKKKLHQILDFVVKTPFSRYPIYGETKDKIIGVLDVDDVLRYTKEKKLTRSVKSIAREVMFVPRSKEIDDLLTEFEREKKQMAIVVDEYGEVSGLITVEDILEEIVGDIFDKSHRESVFIKKVNEKLVRVDAKASVEEVNKILHLGLKAENFSTMAGFVVHRLKRLPKRGEKIKLSKVTIEVDKVTKQGVESLKIRKE